MMIEKPYYKNLKKYLKDDPIYQDFIKNNNIEISDFDMFCIEHCQDINNSLIDLVNEKIVIIETIDELKSVQKWLDNYKFVGYYPSLENRIEKLQTILDDLNNKGGDESEV